MNEAETCRRLVCPRIEAAGWDKSPHSIGDQVTFTDGRIVVAGSKAVRRDQKRADFLLRYRRDLTLAVVEGKRVGKPAGTGMQQAKDYTEILRVELAYATNGVEIVEFDYFTGRERFLDACPAPDAFWARYKAGSPLIDAEPQRFLTPSSVPLMVEGEP